MNPVTSSPETSLTDVNAILDSLEICKRVATQKKIVTGLESKLVTERMSYTNLLKQLVEQQAKEFGTGKLSLPKPANPKATSRNEVRQRITELRDQGLSAKAIADSLNSAGFVPLRSAKFSSATVYSMIQQMQQHQPPVTVPTELPTAA